MNKLFEPVYFDHSTMFWDYRIRLTEHFKGYYHWHQCCECMLVHEGQGTVVLNRQTYRLRKGMLFFFQPYQLHQVYVELSSDQPYERSIFYVDPLAAEELLGAFPARRARFEALCRDSGQPHAYDLQQDAERMEWVFDTYQHAHSSGKGEDPEELTLFFLQFLQHLPEAAFAGSGSANQSKPMRSARYSERVMSWIEAHYQEKISMDHLAAALHLSNNYISRIFREETGSSVSDYLTARRIKQACRLLDTTDLPVSLVADAIGYDNPSYFIHLFKKV
ncbi:MAG: hypothetical protein K0Q90_4375, partial [Paenibacillaceae bacterium]|nr:hypothetical protein [Paenibacillaceae bacterium]